MQCEPRRSEEHKKEMMAVQDSMDVLNGKWKIAHAAQSLTIVMYLGIISP